MKLEGPSDNFKKYTGEDKNIQEEKQVGDLLLELRQYLPSRVGYLGFYPSEIERGGKKEVEDWVSPFVGHPERVEWLRTFVNDAKEKMKATLPEGVSVDVLNTRWREFYNSPTGSKASDAIFKTTREIRDAFHNQIWSYGDKDKEANQEKAAA